MPSVFLALISYFGWGSGDVFGAIATRKIGAFSTTFWVNFIAVFLFALYIPFDVIHLWKFTPVLLLTTLLLGTLYIAGNVALNIAITGANVSVVTTIGASFSGLVVILSNIFLHEQVTLLEWIILGIMFVGVLLCTLNFRELTRGKILQDKGFWYALFAMVAWGMFFTFIKPVMAEVGWFWPTYIAIAMFPLIFMVMKLRGEPLKNPLHTGAILAIIFSGVALRCGDFAFNIGGAMGYTSIVAPIAMAYPTLTALLGYFVFRDPITKQQVAGIVITLIGIVLLGFAM